MKHELKELINRVNSLRPAWSKLAHLTYMEMDALRQGQETLGQLNDDDWELIRDFFAYVPRERENFPRVVKRASFLTDPAGTLAAAEEWAKTHRRAKTVTKAAAIASARDGEEISGAEAIRILRGDEA